MIVHDPGSSSCLWAGFRRPAEPPSPIHSRHHRSSPILNAKHVEFSTSWDIFGPTRTSGLRRSRREEHLRAGHPLRVVLKSDHRWMSTHGYPAVNRLPHNAIGQAERNGITLGWRQIALGPDAAFSWWVSPTSARPVSILPRPKRPCKWQWCRGSDGRAIFGPPAAGGLRRPSRQTRGASP